MNAHTTVVGVRELRGKLSEYLRRIAAGERIDVVVRGKEIVQLTAAVKERENWPSADPKSPNFRKPGALAGQGWIPDGWDDPDPELEDSFYNSVLFPPTE